MTALLAAFLRRTNWIEFLAGPEPALFRLKLGDLACRMY